MPKVLHYKTNFLNISETFIDRLVKNHKRFSPVALCFRPRFFTEDIPVYTLPAKGLSRWMNIAAFHLNAPLPCYYKTTKKLRPDVIHAHFGFDAVKLIQISNSLEIPLVVSFYGSDVSRLPSEFGWKRRYKKLAQYGTLFIAASEVMKKSLIELGFPADKIRVVRFGVDLTASSYLEEYMPVPKIMMVGRMVEKKGFIYAIQAVQVLKKRGIKVELNLYGNGPLMQELKEKTESLGLSEQVLFHGYQPVETILEAHNNHSILLAPSVTAKDGDMEGLPNTILEAMARGTPVVASRHAAIPEVITHQETGFLVEEKNLIELADTLENILTGAYDLESIRCKARKVVESDYSVNRMVTNVEKLYNEVLGMELPDEESPNPSGNSDISEEIYSDHKKAVSA